MQIGIVGLGRMGGNIARRLARGGHEPVVFDRSSEATDTLAAEGHTPAAGLADMVQKLARPRAIWLMLPEGPITETAVEELGELLDDGGRGRALPTAAAAPNTVLEKPNTSGGNDLPSLVSRSESMALPIRLVISCAMATAQMSACPDALAHSAAASAGGIT